jgi:Xaa-Pro aminopeptidase
MVAPEQLLDGFVPDFEFSPINPLPASEFETRLRRILREAVIGEYDGVIINSEMAGWLRPSNHYLRYVCDWMREGILIVPTDKAEASVLLSFYSDAALVPPPGEPTWVDDIRQVGGWGRQFFDRPGDITVKLVEATESVIAELGLKEGRFALIGDRMSTPYWAGLARAMPKMEFEENNEIILRMQRIRSAAEQNLIRAAAQLIDIGIQAAYHVVRPGVTDREILAAFSYAQLARGGETADGYQIGINTHGTHVSKPYGHVVRPGDIIQLYISTVTYRGYNAQAARMVAVGNVSDKQEEVFEMCVDAVQRAMLVARPGVLVSDVHAAAFEAYIERGFLDSAQARSMPWNWEPNADGTPRSVPRQDVRDEDWEAQGRKLRHVYPATIGPNSPGLGHELALPGMRGYPVTSSNHDELEPGMMFVTHAQWLDPLQVGCNLGNALLVTDDGVENLSCHTPLEPFRVEV